MVAPVIDHADEHVSRHRLPNRLAIAQVGSIASTRLRTALSRSQRGLTEAYL